MGRKTFLWLLFVLFSIASAVFALAYFSQAFPIVSIDLKMDRSGAFESARELAERYGWGPESYRQAASFGVDSSVQTYVELEAGGAEAFRGMIEGDLYAPYTWLVRHFRENEANETQVIFTPAGDPYGFREKLPEDQAGAALDGDAARLIAEKTAFEEWGVGLSDFHLIEESEELRTGGRIDHTFVYERNQEGPGESLYRLRLVVGGDRLTSLVHSVKVPEEFIRSYEEMRSANDTIALISNVAFFLLYILGGCVIGLFFLLRDRWVIWRTPLLWGCIIGGLQFLAGINYFPIMWMNYDTALSSESFVLQQVGGVFGSSVLMTILMVLSFMAAESLTRRAFPEHIQLWKIWSKGAASTGRVAGYTVAGYLLVSVFFAYEVILYLLNSNLFGWWSPSDALFDPDLLATYLPWLGSIANSAQAGFWEECLFRAVPLAGAALLGKRFGKKRWWIGSALVLQALIFAAGHANYPAQPAYARVVELIIPALGFGLIYLAYGLLPAIVLHYAYDVVWMSLPLFVSSASGIWLNRIMVIILTFVPLGVVLYARMKTGSWENLSGFFLNASWRPKRESRPGDVEIESEGDLEDSPASSAAGGLQVRARYGWMAVGVAALIAWCSLADFSPDVPPIEVGRDSVESRAVSELESRGIFLDDSWKTVSTIIEPSGTDDSFIWREGGPTVYRKLMGEFLSPPLWRVRFMTFEGTVSDRAEEYKLFFNGNGELVRYSHALPEKARGAVLEESDARRLADRAVESMYGTDPGNLGFVSSQPIKRDNRRDWIFVYSDSRNYDLESGEARIEVSISGDEVTDSRRFVFVPEDWSREERGRRMIREILRFGSYGILGILLLAGVVWAVVSWSRRDYSPKAFLYAFLAFLLLNLLGTANGWYQVLSNFSTAQPFRNQVLVLLLGGSLVSVFMAGGLGLLVGLSHYLCKFSRKIKDPYSNGIILGLTSAGVMSLRDALLPDLEPFWPESGNLDGAVPFLGYLVSPLTSLLILGTLFLFVFSSVNYLSRGWTRHRFLFASGLVIFGLVLTGTMGAAGILSWLATGLLSGVVLLVLYLFLIRHNPVMVVPATAAIMVLGQAREAWVLTGILPWAGAAAGTVFVVLLTWFWCRHAEGMSSE